jgi:hypothetical protein
MYLDEVRETFKGDKFTANPIRSAGITQVPNLNCFNNSGIGCLALAIAGGAKRIIMLGYDCQKTDGKTHWHGDHPKGLGNANGVERWNDTFHLFADTVGIEIINASRVTALDAFPTLSLEKALRGKP